MVRDDDDRFSLLQLLRDAIVQEGVALHAYALLDGRFDLVATPQQSAALSRVMQTVARRHAAAFNRRYQRSGSLWEGRFRAAVIEPESWLLNCMRYVEQLIPSGNSSEEGGSISPRVWSSRAAHSGEAADPFLTHPIVYWLLGNTPFEREAAYQKLAEQVLTPLQREQVDGALRGGWVLGRAAFADKLRQSEGRPASPRPRGRPRRKDSSVPNL